MKKRLLSKIIGIALTATMLIPPTYAAAPDLTMTIGDVSPTFGATSVTVPIQVDSVDSVRAFSFDLLYDRTKLDYTGFTVEPANASWATSVLPNENRAITDSTVGATTALRLAFANMQITYNPSIPTILNVTFDILPGAQLNDVIDVKFASTSAVTAEASYTNKIWDNGTVTLVAGPTAPVASNVTIAGTETVGQTLTGSFTYTDANGDAAGTHTYRWLRADAADGTYTAITGATATTYVLTSADRGKFLKFEATPVSTIAPLTGTAVASSATGAIAASNTAPTATNVTISGSTVIGSTLTGNYTFTDLDGYPNGSTFRWMISDAADGVYSAIVGAAADTYLIQSGDLGKFIKFEVTPIATGQASNGTGSVVTSAATTAIVSGPVAPTATNVTVTGTTKVGEVLTGTFTYVDANGDPAGTHIYKWYRADAADGTYTQITGASATTYTLTSSDLNKFIKFEVTPVSTVAPTAGTAVRSTATAQIAVAEQAPVASNVAVAGTLMVGQTLTGSFTYADANGDAAGTHTYRWLRATTATGTYSAIVGATTTTYTLTADDAGKYVKFEVTPVAATGKAGTLIGSPVLSTAQTIPALSSVNVTDVADAFNYRIDNTQATTGTIRGVLLGTTAAELKARLTKVAPTWEVYQGSTTTPRVGNLVEGDTLVVTAEDNLTKKTYTINLDTFSVSAQFQVNGVDNAHALVAGSHMLATGSATNLTASTKDIIFVVALFDASGNMVNYSFDSDQVLAGATTTLSAGFKLPASVTGYTVKSFVWEGTSLLTNTTPVSNVIQLQ